MSGNQSKREEENIDDDYYEKQKDINGEEENEFDDNKNQESDDVADDDYIINNMEETQLEESCNSSNHNDEEDVDIDYGDDDVNSYFEDRDDRWNEDDCHLQLAMRKRKSTSTIMKLIKLFPMEVKHQNSVGYYPLHTACDCYYEDDVTMKLIELFPEAAQYETSSGLYPLQIAFDHVPSEDLLLKLIEIFPEAVRKSPIYGTVLHEACDNNLSVAVITKLIETNPLAIQEKNYCEGKYPIQYAIGRHGQEVIKLLLDGDPLGMQRKFSYGSNDVTPFHLACKTDNADVVKYLIQRSDLQINVRDSDGKTPLHYACEYLQDKIVEILLHHPDVDVNARGSFNSTPLHQVSGCYGNPERRLEIFKKLLDHPFILISPKTSGNFIPLDYIKVKVINNLEGRNDPRFPKEIESRCLNEIVNLLEEFPIKQRWQAYCYHVNEFIM